MTTAARRSAPLSAPSLRLHPALAALALLAVLALAPALAGFEPPSDGGEDWRGNSAGSTAR